MPKVSIGLDGNLVDEVIVGIDLGTTNSLVAVVDNDGLPHALSGKSNSSIVPSLLHFGPEGQIVVGSNARQFLVESPERTIYSVKRLMGRSYKDLEKNQGYFSYKIIDDEDTGSLVKVRVDNRFYTPIELSSFILKELKQRAEQELGKTVKKAVITVPAYFNDAQRQATRDAGKLAGLEVLRIINEPTAASLAYGLEKGQDQEKIVAVYDLGGGTFDISILRISHGIYEVLSTNGDTFLGGDDFDRALVNHWIALYGINPEDFKDSDSIKQELRLLAEELKKQLSEKTETESLFYCGDKQYVLRLNRQDLSRLIEPFIVKTLDCCKKAVEDSGIRLNDIEELVLVGGSTRTIAVRESVTSYFSKSKLHTGLDPDEVVALGAAIEADILSGRRKDMLLLDITPLSLGIETLGGLMDVLIPRNSKIPSSLAKQYTTSHDGQVNMKISVYQGEREMVEHNRKLGEFELKGIPAMPAGFPKN